MSLIEKATKVIFPIALILSALLIGTIVIKTTRKPAKQPPRRTAYAVKVMPLQPGRQPVRLQATGTVMPAQDVMLQGRVAGEIIQVAPEFIDGGTFKQGELILSIDPVDYKLALEQKKAALAEAEYQLKLEQGQSDIAAREWDLLGGESGGDDVDRDLAMRVPHLKYRKAQLAAAQAELEKAELDLTRTEVRAPFNAVVVQRDADLGSQVGLQDVLAALAGTDRFYVRASIPVDKLRWITSDAEKGSSAVVTRSTGDVRQGRVIRQESALEELGRMARVLIAVDDPLEGDYPMLLNEYVRIEIQGAAIEDAYLIPRSALREDRYVWLAAEGETLEIREVEVAWRDADSVLVTGGLASGERLILTNLSTPVNDMKLRIAGEPEKNENQPEEGSRPNGN